MVVIQKPSTEVNNGAVLCLLVVKGSNPAKAVIWQTLLQTSVLSVFLAAAVWAMLHPSRGIQDRIAGTWIVPR